MNVLDATRQWLRAECPVSYTRLDVYKRQTRWSLNKWTKIKKK